MKKPLLILVLSLLFIISTIVLLWRNTTQETFSLSNDPIYCIMITGKDDCRIEHSRNSLVNFLDQDYAKGKYMIIVNHHKELSVLDKQYQHENVIEIKVNKNESTTLGDMRNIALELIPIDGLWTTWDDDDYRPYNYLSLLHQKLIESKTDAIAFTDRYEYNANNNNVWKISLKTGFVTILARKHLKTRYLSQNTMEDVEIKTFYPNLYIWKNRDILLYVRLIHDNNTSLYVDKLKNVNTLVNSHDDNTYKEMKVDDSEKQMVMDIISPYFNRVKCLLISTQTPN